MKRLQRIPFLSFEISTFLALVLMFQPSTALGAGVTIITHGFEISSALPVWLSSMRDAISDRIPVTSSKSEVEIRVSVVPGQGLHIEQIGEPGQSDEILVVLNWASVAFFKNNELTEQRDYKSDKVATDSVAEVVVDYLLQHQEFLRLPIHLVGHSRGASLVSSIARQLGEDGIWIDQLTTLDPHPLSSSLDEEVTIHDNVLFADNYWRSDGGLVKDSEDEIETSIGKGDKSPDGQYIDGTYSRELTSLPDGYAELSGGDHSDVHLWYHGTMDLASPVTVDGVTLTQNMRSSWYDLLEEEGAHAGFHFSRIGGGARLADPTITNIKDGYHHLLGGNGSRNDISNLSSVLWPNLIRLELQIGQTELHRGDQLYLSFVTQDLREQSRIRIYLDTDQNPFNAGSNDYLAYQKDIIPRQLSFDEFNTGTISEPVPSSVPDGNYFVLGKIDNYSGLERYLYCQTAIKVLPPCSITVGNPNGGECYFPGNDLSIRWTSTFDPEEYVQIDLFKSGVFNRTIDNHAKNDGETGWLIPADQSVGDDYKIRITSSDDASCWNESGSFAISSDCGNDNYEPNNSRETAYDLRFHKNTWLSTLDGRGITFYNGQSDEDWYQIFLSDDSEVIEVTCQFINELGDIDLYLYDNSGGGQPVSDSTCHDPPDSCPDFERIQVNLRSRPRGIYYIKVIGADTLNQYDLIWDDGRPPQPTDTLTPTVTPTETHTPSVTETLTVSPTASSTATDSPSATSTPTPTPTQSNTAAPTPTRSATPTPSPTISATVTPTPNPAFDANNDGIINAADLLLFLSDWMEFVPTKTPTPVE
jgi:hypothetical protein